MAAGENTGINVAAWLLTSSVGGTIVAVAFGLQERHCVRFSLTAAKHCAQYENGYATGAEAGGIALIIGYGLTLYQATKS
jgi:hypothetical protein